MTLQRNTYQAKSMTAFGRAEIVSSLGSFIWEVRSVNHRYLETNFRMPETFRQFEIKLKEKLRKRIARGKCDISLQFQRAANDLDLNVNQASVNALIKAQEQIKAIATEANGLNVQQILNWQGVLVDTEMDIALLEELLLNSFEQAVEHFIEVRQSEGARMADVIDERLEKINDIVRMLEKELPEILQEYEQKIRTKLAELIDSVDEDRLGQEMVLLAQKTDVAEELDRLKAHVLAVKEALQKAEPCGRRLDFLMQELNREANTLGSKSISLVNTNGAIELKVLIEQMREQVQNIE